MRSRAVVLDLDGTLIDVSQRHHAVYRDVLDELGEPAIPFERYWALKRADTPWAEILGNGLEKEFLARFRERIEQPSYLALDRLFPFTRPALDALAAHELYLLTLRRSPEALQDQLDRLDLARHFKAVVSGERKRELIATIPGREFVVGDTEADVAAAREVGAISVAVASGIRNETVLRRAEPDHLADDISVLPKLLCA